MSDSRNAVAGKGGDADADRRRTSPITFLRQVIAELRKVVWPTRMQLVNYFFVVLVFVLFVMAIVAGLDFGFTKAMFWIFGEGLLKQ